MISWQWNWVSISQTWRRSGKESNKSIIGYETRNPASKMYVLSASLRATSCALVSNINNSESELCHRRLAHINDQDLTRAHKYADDVLNVNVLSRPRRVCKLGNAHELPFSGHFKRATEAGEIIHSDIFGNLELSFSGRFIMCARLLTTTNGIHF